MYPPNEKLPTFFINCRGQNPLLLFQVVQTIQRLNTCWTVILNINNDTSAYIYQLTQKNSELKNISGINRYTCGAMFILEFWTKGGCGFEKHCRKMCYRF
ncbi:hypothetical protein PV328_007232 [Microctonus aethiopoides]|uniref:Uncharacterized protein n=1 Tax=Microctonus aethiopoides TaxID=144406 RepID=A0AA39FRD0_9HYME|nr:hypothetical protein PV328_007232 [Microctonus aethiopoides]